MKLLRKALSDVHVNILLNVDSVLRPCSVRNFNLDQFLKISQKKEPVLGQN